MAEINLLTEDWGDAGQVLHYINASGVVRAAPHNLIKHSEDVESVGWVMSGDGTGTNLDGGSFELTIGGLQSDIISTQTVGNEVFSEGQPYHVRFKLSNPLFAVGTLIVRSPPGSSTGRWEIDLEQIPPTFIQLDANHPAVTEVNPYVGAAGDIGGVAFTMNIAGQETLQVREISIALHPNTLYVATTTTPLYRHRQANETGELIQDYDGVTHEAYIEASEIENLIEASNGDDSSAWSAIRSSWVLSSTTDPATGQQSGLLTEDSTVGDTHTIVHVLSLTDDTELSIQVMLKPNGRAKGAIFFFDNAGGTNSTNYDLEAETFVAGSGTTTDHKILALANGWHSLSFMVDTANGASAPQLQIRLQDGTGDQSYNGDGVSGVHVYGFTLCECPFVPQPILTFGTTVTKATENVEISIEESASITMLVDVKILRLDAPQSFLTTATGSSTPRAHFDVVMAGSLRLLTDGISHTGPVTTAVGEQLRAICAYSSQQSLGRLQASDDTLAEGTATVLPTAADSIFLGRSTTGGQRLDTYLDEMTIHTNLFATEAQMEALLLGLDLGGGSTGPGGQPSFIILLTEEELEEMFF